MAGALRHPGLRPGIAERDRRFCDRHRFSGLFVGTALVSFVADRFGRRTIFTYSLLWYTAASAVMAFQHHAFGLNLWRFVSGIGVGVELVTIDTYLSELVPANLRGRAFAINQAIQFCAVPMVALLAWLLVPRAPLSDGWPTALGCAARRHRRDHRWWCQQQLVMILRLTMTPAHSAFQKVPRWLTTGAHAPSPSREAFSENVETALPELQHHADLHVFPFVSDRRLLRLLQLGAHPC